MVSKTNCRRPRRHAKDHDCSTGPQAPHCALAASHHRRGTSRFAPSSGCLTDCLRASGTEFLQVALLLMASCRGRTEVAATRYRTMVFEPRFRMGPPPRSFAADAHDCIMVTVLTDRPNTSLWREVAPDSELPSVTSSIANTDIATQGVPTPQPSLPRSNKSAAVLATCAQQRTKKLDRDEEIVATGSNK